MRSSSSNAFLRFFIEEKMKLLTHLIDSLSTWLIIQTDCLDLSKSAKFGNFCVSLFVMVVLCELYAGHCSKKCFPSSTITTLSSWHCLQTYSSIGNGLRSNIPLSISCTPKRNLEKQLMTEKLWTLSRYFSNFIVDLNWA